MKRIFTAISFLMLCAPMLSGCSGNLLGPSGAPAKLYTLKAPQQLDTTAAIVTWQLLIEMPAAQIDLNSSRIAIAPSAAQIDYYADVAWADRPPAMLQELLLQSFEKSGRIPAVQRQSGGLRADFVLATDLQDFEADAESKSVHVLLAAHLIRPRDRSIVATRNFEANIPINGDFDSVIGGFDKALQQILPEIVDWTLTQGSRNP